jgi:cyclopropane fatty-acyl-phospholipid synthase-like methyltransferase
VAALTYGNAAKLYCLRLLDEAIRRANGTFRIVDLGCGDGRNFVELLRRHSQVDYVGVDPSRHAFERAKERLPHAQIAHMRADEARFEPADAVVSFSVLEHVADRKRYLQAVRANLAADGRAYLNYDSGHFGADATASERTKAAVARAFAAFGRESWYRARVHDDEFSELLVSAGLRVVEEKGFNTDLKLTYRAIPEARRDLFMDRWVAFELDLNEAGIGFDERVFRTRNVILARG